VQMSAIAPTPVGGFASTRVGFQGRRRLRGQICAAS
jgi:hypothetical protein